MSGMSRRTASVLLVFALSTLAGIYFATQLRLAYQPPYQKPWGQALTVNLTYYWAWGALVPVVVALAQRFRLEPGHWKLGLAVHVPASVLITIVQIIPAAAAIHMMMGRPGRSAAYDIAGGLMMNFHSSYPTYWVILFAYLAFDYHAKYRDRAVRASQLEARLSEARLHALQMQLNPHFLFNTLNSISSLMYTDVEAADAMMTRLSELLRATLHGSQRQEVSLREELELLDRYLDIERIRFEKRLRVRMDVEPAALEGLVPAFCLQPLVENAIRHAIALRPDGGRIEIQAVRENGRLRIVMGDDGPGLPEGDVAEGVGLGNTRARLEQLYGGNQRLELKSREGGGLQVEVAIPFRTTTS
jgi:LytS/YehU family sensor histidine kinase